MTIRKISRDLSGYLNFVRFMAALSVLLGHLAQDGIPIDWISLAKFSHESVIIFFVLSGFIIYNNTKVNSVTAASYAISRISRVYSVALPAIVFSLIIAFFYKNSVEYLKPSNYVDFSWLYVFSSLFFLNESWNNPSRLTLNDPYWSLCYEVWFYVLFGLFVFTRGFLRRSLLACIFLIAGPAVVALLPIWLLGAWAAKRLDSIPRWSPALSWCIYALAPVLMLVVNVTEMDLAVRQWLNESLPGVWRLRSSQRFLTDYVLGMAVVAHLFAFSSLPAGFREFFVQHQKTLSQMAGFSFTIYLFHRPLTQVVGTYYSYLGQTKIGSFSIACFIVLLCWIISYATEGRLRWWRLRVEELFFKAIITRKTRD